MGWGNNRAVSEVLGAILLFGIIILALGSYQAFVVPQQNAAIESNHDAQVSDEFAEIQPAISNAAASGRTRTTSVTLGTRYPVRAAALNPPTVSGQLGTGTRGNITADGFDSTTLEDICGLAPETQAITYDANYNELDDTGAFAYENGVTYRDTGNGILVRNEQELVDGSTIRLYPLVGDGFSTGGSSSEQLRFIPGETGVQTINTGGDKLNVTFPSRLEGSTWRNEILNDAANFLNSNDSDGNITVTLNPGTYTIKCTPIGIGSAPAQGSVPTPVEDTGGLNINSRNSDVFLKSTGDFDSNSPTITLKNNGSDAWNLKQARIPFATGDNQSEANVTMDGSQIEILRVADGFSSFGATIPANGEITLKFNFTGEFYPGSSQPGNGWFIFTVEQSQGNDSEFRNYFISDGLNTNTNGGEDDDCPGNSC